MKNTNDLVNQIDLMRGRLQPEDMLELITLLLLLKHDDLDAMTTLANMGKASQSSELNRLIEQAKDHFPIEVLTSPNLLNATNNLHSAIDFVMSYDNLSLCSELRNAINMLGRISWMGASHNEQTLFSAILADLPVSHLYDGSAGLANIASQIPSKMTLGETNPTTYSMSYRLLTVEGKSFDYKLVDSLVQPSIEENAFDLVVMTPPFGLRLTNTIEIGNAPYLLPELPTKIPTSASDSLWIQLALYALSTQGKAYLLLPLGVFFRGGYDSALRAHLIENELIEAIISLPKYMLDQTMIPTVLLVLNKAKPKGSAIHFVDVRHLPLKDGRKLVLTQEQAQEIADMARGLTPDDAHYKAVYLPEIRENDYDLSVARYFYSASELAFPNVTDEKLKLANTELNHQQSQAKLMSLLSKY